MEKAAKGTEEAVPVGQEESQGRRATLLLLFDVLV